MSDNSRPSPVIQTNSTVPRTQSSTTSGGGTGTNGRPVGLMLDFVSSVSADATQSSGTLSRKQPTMMRPIEQHIRTSSLTSVVPNNSSNPTQQLGSTSNVQVGFGLLGGHETGLSSPGAGWVSITEKVAPLFQGRGLKGSIDELNELVRWDIRHLMESGAAAVTADIQHLLQSGIESLGIKLQAVAAVVPPTDEGDLIYLTRLADAWSYFFSTTLVFLQAVFLPATAPPIMSSMDVSSSMSSSAAPISTTTTSLGPNATAQHPLASHSQYPLAKGLIGLSVLHGIPLPEPRPLHELRVSLDIRSTALVKFKDCLLWPIRLRLQELCSSEKKIEFANGGSGGGARDTFGRISHMLSILASVTENDFEREFLVSCLTSFCHVNGSL